jgi:hypothetical protein
MEGRMTRTPRTRSDPIEKEIERALHPGEFITYRAGLSLVSGLEDVSSTIAGLIDTDPGRAAALYETFLFGCHEKAGDLDDSSGGFGQFVGGLFRRWIKARQANGADPEKTAARLLGWMDDDSYGFCYHLERDAAKAFDKAGLAAFVKRVRGRFDNAAKTKPAEDSSPKDNPEYLRKRWGEALRTLYIAQKNIAAYVALTNETGLTAKDCLAIGTLLAPRRKPEEALAWLEKGLACDKNEHGSIAGHELAMLKRELLVRLGRETEALDSAWADYRGHPSRYSYDDLMRFVPKAEQTKWHEKAIEAAEGADLHSLMTLLLETKELERLATLVRESKESALESLSHYVTQPAARKIEKTHPDLAARLWLAQGMRIVKAKKSTYYDAALSNFENAKRCFERAGLDAKWQETVSRVRADHRRKIGFMPGFEKLVAGAGPSRTPSFLERAKARWGGGQGRNVE